MKAICLQGEGASSRPHKPAVPGATPGPAFSFSAGRPGHGGPAPARAAVARVADFVAARLARLSHPRQAQVLVFPTGAVALAFHRLCARDWEEAL